MTEKMISVRSGDMNLSALQVFPEGEARGLVQISHGMIEMKERYLPLMRFLAANGYACQAHDHRGHGYSVKSPADLGYLYERGDISLPSDVLEMANQLRAVYPGKKLCLIGHSMGSLVALNCERRFSGAFDALLLSGCPAPNGAAGPGLVLVRLLQKLLGDRNRSAWLEKIVFGPYQKKFRPRSPYNWISTDAEEVRLHETDPLMNYRFTLNGYETLLRLLKEAHSSTPFTPQSVDMPIRLLAGADDPCIGSLKILQNVGTRLKKDGYTDVEVKTWAGMRHEIFRAPEKEQVFEDVLLFLNRALRDDV